MRCPILLLLVAVTGCNPFSSPPKPEKIAESSAGVQAADTDGEHLYWATWNGYEGVAHIERAPLSGGDTEVLAQHGGSPRHLVVHGKHVYWTDESNLLQVRKKGGEPKTIRKNVGPGPFVVDDDAIFILSGREVQSGVAQLVRIDPEDGSRKVLVDEARGSELAIDDEHVYWVSPHLGKPTRIMKVSKKGGDPKELADGVNISTLALDGEHVYYCALGKLRRMDKDGGSSMWLLSGCGEHLTVRGDVSYWSANQSGGARHGAIYAGSGVSSKSLYEAEANVAGPVVRDGDVYWLGASEQGGKPWTAWRLSQKQVKRRID